jgi:hypothetical protein
MIRIDLRKIDINGFNELILELFVVFFQRKTLKIQNFKTLKIKT